MKASNSTGNGRAASVDVDFAELTVCLKRDPRVIAGVVFGSSRNGQVASGSDLDVAVLFEKPLSAKDFLTFYSDLCDQVPSVAAVGLTPLNQAHPILAFEALNGRFLCVNDREKMAAYFSLVCREYEDVMGNLEHQRHLVA